MIDLRLGDCLEILPTLADRSVDAIITDLPYGTTACKWDVIIPLAPMWEQVRRLCKGAFVTTASQPFTTDLINSNRKWFRYEIVWCKNQPTGAFNANKMPMKSHENILVFYLQLPTYNPIKTERTENELKRFMRNPIKTNIENSVYGDFERTVLGRDAKFRNPDSLIFCDVVNGRNGDKVPHPTQKPVALYEYLIRTYTNEGDTVLDFCAGSGTTGVACVRTNRNFIGIEKEQNYFEIAKRRIQEAQQIGMELPA